MEEIVQLVDATEKKVKEHRGEPQRRTAAQRVCSVREEGEGWDVVCGMIEQCRVGFGKMRRGGGRVTEK